MKYFKVGSNVLLNNPEHRLNGRLFRIVSYVNHAGLNEYCLENENNKIFSDGKHLKSVTDEQAVLIREAASKGYDGSFN